jgi:colicin import membrane protein
MKKILFAILMCLPVAVMAQDNTWEKAETDLSQKTNPDQKYLAGAVPEVDGKVLFSTVIEAPGKSADEVYDIVHNYMQSMLKEPNQIEQSRLVIEDKATHQVVGSYQEWLVFKSTALVLDRTRLLYNLIVDCENGKATVKMTRIIYIYDEEREMQRYLAEDWITDKEGLNRKQNKLARVSGKFRRKTIDRKDYLFQKIASLLK